MKPHGMIIDNFAGGGGASTGIEAALGRAVDIAINHDEAALRMHEVNHPGTVHIRNNIWQVHPADVVAGRHVSLAWFSPDCKHFSKAKGGKPREKSIRDLAWVVVLWAQKVKPDLILLENVEEFRTWGPLDDEGYPIKDRAGETFDKWTKALRREGYKMQWRELRACDYGAPTIRKRFFMIARRDGNPIAWPAPTHGKPDSDEVTAGKLKPWRTAAEIIDWSIPCPSIFERKKPLAEKTLRRIAHGIMKFVVNNPRPFIVPLTHHGSDGRSYGLGDPIPTVTGANRGEMALATPFFARTAHGDVDKNGKRRGQPCHGPEDGFPTVTQSQDSALIIPHVTKFRTGAIGHAVDEPMHTVTANSFVKRPGGAAPLGVVEAAIAPFATYAQQGGASRSVEDPMHTVTASRKDQNCVAAVKVAPVIVGCGGRRGQSAPVGPEQPYPTTTAKADACVVSAFLAQFSETREGRKLNPGHAVEQPVSTIVQKGPLQAAVTSNLIKLRGGDASHLESSGVDVSDPMHTVCASGTHMAEVRAFLLKYYGTDQDPQLGEPLHTVTTKDRYGLVTVTIDGEEYVIVDIGMRMLTPRELFNAQGFPADYIIDRDAEGRPMTKTAQVAKCGNSVCPPVAEALVRANMAHEIAVSEAEAA